MLFFDVVVAVVSNGSNHTGMLLHLSCIQGCESVIPFGIAGADACPCWSTAAAGTGSFCPHAVADRSGE